MATPAGAGRTNASKSLRADRYETVLAGAAVVLLVAILVALAKGAAHWGSVPLVVWGHLATVVIALALTPVMLLRPRGDAAHRMLGKVWVVAMFLTAAESFFVRHGTPPRFSFIHILSAYVVLAAPLIWWTARTHRIAAHRRQVRGMVTGALLIAGFFTLPPFRLLGQWLTA
ncbi:DUF2306 domain-containing protein [Sphingomonas sp. AAP5]|uniref:DUF2306 domain-containing protein n=1 Tax=Sphingomonas glacialis TaxID=658225 RepID=A0ABQ3LHJ8_9SPHN|nr:MULTISPECIES: DUF2306 domain-containing protein [Sphingomonas]QBM76729.1 DUF2306 domain-containing protein [Sphingomonas sp. AAP5]GHH16215.1 hypothetical protein GCM10008023_19980 [Sphingomonas glacialis]